MGGNGEKSKLIYWLLGLLQVIVLTFCWWVGSNAVQAKADVAVLQANYHDIKEKLDSIDKKMDSFVFRNR